MRVEAARGRPGSALPARVSRTCEVLGHLHRVGQVLLAPVDAAGGANGRRGGRAACIAASAAPALDLAPQLRLGLGQRARRLTRAGPRPRRPPSRPRRSRACARARPARCTLGSASRPPGALAVGACRRSARAARRWPVARGRTHHRRLLQAHGSRRRSRRADGRLPSPPPRPSGVPARGTARRPGLEARPLSWPLTAADERGVVSPHG